MLLLPSTEDSYCNEKQFLKTKIEFKLILSNNLYITLLMIIKKLRESHK
jgi:hypothetical protein